jgi:hypothetical protein
MMSGARSRHLIEHGPQARLIGLAEFLAAGRHPRRNGFVAGRRPHRSVPEPAVNNQLEPGTVLGEPAFNV